MEKMRLDIQLFADGNLIIGTEVDTSGIDEGIDETIKKIIELQNKSDTMWAETFQEGEETTQKINEDIEEINENVKKVKINTEEVVKEASKFGNGLTRSIKKVSRLALGIFGIRSAYMLIRRTASELAMENEELANKLTLIKGSLTNLLAPAVEKIVDWVLRLLTYLNMLTKAFFGLDLFAKSSKSSKKTLGNAQKLRKTLAGFDEMNILSDNTTSSGGVGGTGGIGKPEEGEMPQWMQDIIAKKDLIIDGLIGIAGALIAVKMGLGFVMALGIGLMAFGMAELVRDIADPNTDGIEKVVKCLGDALIILGGIVMLFNPFVGIAMALIGFVIKYLPEISNWIDKIETKLANGILKAIEKIKEKFNSLPGWAQKLIKGIVNGWISAINFLIKGLNAMLIPMRLAILVIGKVMGKNWSLEEIRIPSIPKLARGGIVNLPGKGTYVGGAMVGERGAEGVIPLTDSQQMALLGEAIGKYITINASITNTMNGRVISRELQKINNENAFASNR